LQYQLGSQPGATMLIHEIPLDFVTQHSDIDEVTLQIIEQNLTFLGPKIVNQGQVRRLIERMVNHLKSNKENVCSSNNLPT
jgi:hypothetical protein